MFRLPFSNWLSGFKRNEDGAIAVEAILALPVLFWSIMAGYTYFDGYRQGASNLKAAYTIGDLVSRETREINDTYVDSLRELLRLMVRADSTVRMRVSLITWNEDDNRHYVRWSADRGIGGELTNGNIAAFADRLPPMPDADTLIIVETSNDYEPLFDVGVGNFSFDNFIFTRPRFTNEIAANV